MYRFDIYDEIFPNRQATFAMPLYFDKVQTTAKEILKQRIKQDCQTANLEIENAHQAKQARLLAEYQKKVGELTDHEKILNGEKLPKVLTSPTPKAKLRDWQEEFDKAVSAFYNNGFVLIIDDEQITDLDTPLHIKSDDTSKLTFLQLIPLQGG